MPAEAEVPTEQEGVKEPAWTRRTWVYLQRPAIYEIAGCPCGNDDPDWSEFDRHLWCPACQKDFVPAHGSIFDGPIPVETCRMMGISFDPFNLINEQVEPSEIGVTDWSAA